MEKMAVLYTKAGSVDFQWQKVTVSSRQIDW